jgi:glyoxylase-like metal-dependent hydrolase (beta-lactamase superfamily II)
MMLRKGIHRSVVLMALLLLQALSARAQDAVLRTAIVAPGVWAIVGSIGGPSRDNHALNATYGVVATPEGTILIDSGASAQGAQLLAASAKQLTGQAVRWVINTGSQHHRWLGNGHMRSAGAQIIAHRMTVQTQQAVAEMQIVELRGLLADRFAGTQAVHAERVLEGESSEIVLGGVRVALLALGDAHFPGDTVVWLPEQRIVFAGDLVYAERLLSVAALSNPRSWLAAFERLVRLAPAQVVPGHGSPTTLALAQSQTGAYLRLLVDGVARHAKEMAGVEAALAELGDAPAFVHLANFSQLHRGNINRAYLRAEAGD